MTALESSQVPGSVQASMVRQDLVLVNKAGKSKKVNVVVDVQESNVNSRSQLSVASYQPSRVSQNSLIGAEKSKLQQFTYTDSVLRLIYDNSLISS